MSKQLQATSERQKQHLLSLQNQPDMAFTSKNPKMKNSNPNHPLVWHYTIGQKYQMINESGTLLTEDETTPHVPIEGMPGGVWFSRRQDFEPTAGKMMTNGVQVLCLNFKQTAALGGGAVRIGIPAKASWLLSWRQFRRRCKCETRIVENIEEVVLQQGSDVKNFLVSLKPVPRAKWSAIEFLHNGMWVSRKYLNALN